MKRMQVILLILLVFTAALPAHGQQPASNNISVFIDGLPVSFDVEPVIHNNRVLVPFRAAVEALNTEVRWAGSTRTINAQKEGITVQLQIDNKSAFRNGNIINLEAPARLHNNRTVIPLRFFAEAFDCDVKWDRETRTVNIFSPPVKMTVTGFYALGDKNTSSWTNLFGRSYPETGTGNTDIVGELALGWYTMDKDGKLSTSSTTGWQRPGGWENVLQAAAGFNLKTEMVIHMTDSGGKITGLVTNREATARAVEEIAAEAELYDGVNLDLEGLGWQTEPRELEEIKNNFNHFVRLLSNELKSKGLGLTLSLHAPNSAYKGYDYQTLGSLADRIIIMAYDYGPRPEPVNMVLEAVDTATKAVPPEKLVLGISAPSETAASIAEKVGIAKRYGLQGIALWRLGLISPDMWDTLKKLLVVKSNF